jgi:hypothetical protein
MEGLQKLQGGPMRKVPASMPLLRGLAEKLDQSIWDDLVTITAIMTMFLFGLRSGEALRSKREPDQEKCLRASMVVFRRNQEVVSGDAIEHADEIVLVMGRSKADTQGQGSVSNLHESKGEILCAVKLIKEMHRRRPYLFSSKDSFLFTLDDGRVLSAKRVSELLKDQGVLAGYSRDSLSVISLRAGFASVAWNEGVSVEKIMATGKWRSNCFKRYIWGGQEVDDLMGSKMLSSKFTPLAAQRKFQRDQEHKSRRQENFKESEPLRKRARKLKNLGPDESKRSRVLNQEERKIKEKEDEWDKRLREAKAWAAERRKKPIPVRKPSLKNHTVLVPKSLP